MYNYAFSAKEHIKFYYILAERLEYFKKILKIGKNKFRLLLLYDYYFILFSVLSS